MPTDHILRSSFSEKWRSSATCRDLRAQLLEQACFVPWGLYRFGPGGLYAAELGNFSISAHLCTNRQVIELLTALALPNLLAGSAYLVNEFNPSLPISCDPSSQRYYVRTGMEEHPVSGVSWQGAALIAAALGGRLPREAEWEVCATAGDPTRRYPWGDQPPAPALANYGEHVGAASAVGSYAPNSWGLYDMAGNLAEWCQDWYHPAVPYAETLERPPRLEASQFEKTVKGGSWNKDETALSCQARRGKWYKIGTVGIGFRIVWDRSADDAL